MQSLLENISLLTKLHGSPISAITLATLTLRDGNGDLNYQSLGEVLAHQGFENELQKRTLDSIPNLALPAVLLLKNSQAAVLKQIDHDVASVKIGELPEQEISIAELQEQYLGYFWFIKPKMEKDVRSELPEYSLPKGWFWRVIWRFRRYYYQVIIATVMINFLALVSSLYVMNVYDRVIPNKSFNTLWVLSIGVFIAIGFEFIAKLIRAHLIDIAGKKADLIISSALFRRVLHLKMQDKPASAGSYANNLRDFESVRDFMTSASMLAFVDMPFFLLFIFVMYMIGGQLAFIPLIIVPIVAIVGLFAQIPLSRAIQESMRESSQRQGLAVEAIEGVETLKSNNAFNWAQRRWDAYTAKSAAANIKSRDYSNLVTNFSTGMQQLNTVFLVLYGTYLIHAEDPAQRITMGALIACVILSGRALAPVAQIAGLAVRFQQARVALDGVNGIASRAIERDPDRQYITLDHVKGSIDFKGVNFSYVQDEAPALKNINLRINPGEKIAILGKIGSGKTTLLKLISGLYEPQQGLVTVDDVDIRQIDPYFLRYKVGFLSQSPRLFLGTLRENLDLARSDGFYSDEVLLDALKRFGLLRLIQSHPKGLDMFIGESGVGLSGGQQQIINLVRLALKDPSIILLDEPTSGLDQGTEQQVLHSLKNWVGDRTMVIVTHRTQILPLVDRIIVMDQGQIVMDGPKQAVLDRLMANEAKSQQSKDKNKVETKIVEKSEPQASVSVNPSSDANEGGSADNSSAHDGKKHPYQNF